MEKGSKIEILAQVDWVKCVLCQKVTMDKLRCHLIYMMQNEVESWYYSFCHSIQVHEQMKSVQERFQTQVRALVDPFETQGNPFKTVATDLLVLSTKEIASAQVVTTVNTIENADQEQFQMFVEERLLKHKKEVTDDIKLTSFHCSGTLPQKPSSKETLDVSS